MAFASPPFTQPEVHNVRASEDRGTENFVKFGHVIFDVCERTNIQTYRHAHRNISQSYRVRINNIRRVLTFGAGGDLTDGGFRHIVVEELSKQHQHERANVIGVVHVWMEHRTHQSGVRQRLSTASNARLPYRYTPSQQKRLRMHARKCTLHLNLITFIKTHNGRLTTYNASRAKENQVM